MRIRSLRASQPAGFALQISFVTQKRSQHGVIFAVHTSRGRIRATAAVEGFCECAAFLQHVALQRQRLPRDKRVVSTATAKLHH